MSNLSTTTAAASSLVTLNLTAEHFEMVLESAASSLRTEIEGGEGLDGAELLAAAEQQLTADGIRASGREYLAQAERPEFAENAGSLRRIGNERIEQAEELAEFHADAIGLYRALLAQAPQLVA